MRRPAAIAALALTWPAAAYGADGIVVDPGSPAGKEYAIPLDSARSQGAPGTTGAGPVPAFGVGVTPAGAGSAPSAPTEPAPAGGVTQPSSRRDETADRPDPAVRRRPVRMAPVPAAASAQPAIWSGLGALAVLVIGLGAGVAFRRRQRR